MSTATEASRETSSATTRLVLGYVREQGGEEAVRRVLETSGVPHTLGELEDVSRWVSYDTRIRLFQATVDVLEDPGAMYAVGASVMASSVSPSLVLILRALGSPAQVYRQLPRAVSKFSTTSTMTVLEAGRTAATLRFQLHEGYVHSRLDCDYARGLISSVPEVFGLPAAHLVHEACESDGDDACVYHATWSRRARWSRGRRREDIELLALRQQLHDLQSASADLVTSGELSEVLERITRRAASGVLANGYVLAVQPADGGRPLVHAIGVPAGQVDALADALLAGRDLGPHAVVVDVVSARRRHGRLAALYADDQVGPRDEQRLLAAYASHAAAALDLVGALEDSRRDGARSRALLTLAHQLAGAREPDDVARLVARALPAVVGCDQASVLLWDPVRGVLAGEASAGMSETARQALAQSALTPQEVPELRTMVTERRPLEVSRAQTVGPLRALLDVTGVTHLTAVPLLVGDELLGVATVGWTGGSAPWSTDVTQRLSGVADQAATALQGARLLSRVQHQALHDSLTGLPNRVLFSERLEHALGAGTCSAVLFCDLDRFKQVNDVLGHAAGDELLRQLAARLLRALPTGATVGRLSGDEFAVLLVDGADPEGAAQQVVACFERPFRVEGHELRVTCSVGVAVAGSGTLRSDPLLRLADGAMYEAKQRGRNQISIACGGTGPAASAAPSLQQELRAALVDDQLRLHYQPVHALPDDWCGDPAASRVVGVEALVRWQHPRLGLLSPDAFLPVAEESGLVVELDLWAVGEATRALAAWTDPCCPAPYRVAVNLSGRSLADPRLRPAVLAALAASGLPADRLELEVVESRALVDLPSVIGQLSALRHLGVRTALDDFGTGFSTLTWLQQLPADRLKLDRTFTASLSDGPHGHALVRGVVALAGELGLDVVAEGVETGEQLAALHAQGCRTFQGYLLGRPGPLGCVPAPLTG